MVRSGGLEMVRQREWRPIRTHFFREKPFKLYRVDSLRYSHVFAAFGFDASPVCFDAALMSRNCILGSPGRPCLQAMDEPLAPFAIRPNGEMGIVAKSCNPPQKQELKNVKNHFQIPKSKYQFWHLYSLGSLSFEALGG